MQEKRRGSHHSGARMKALVLEAEKQIHITNIKTPECKPNETLLKVLYCSVCRTDAKAWSQGQRDLVLPRVLGHEICAKKLDSDQRYIVWPASTCNSCHYCKNAAENLCSSIQVIGFHRDGGFAQYIAAPTDSLITIPETVPSKIACMTELVSSAINAIEQINLQRNQRVLIYGGGPAGLMLSLACRHFGAHPFILEISPEKIKLATAFCKETGIPISDKAPSGNFDAAINAAPDPATLTNGISKLKAGGKYCLFSGFTKNVSVPANVLSEVHYRQLTVVGAYGSTRRQMEKALTIVEKHVPALQLLIQKIITLEDVPAVLPQILQGQALKYVVDLQNDGDQYGN